MKPKSIGIVGGAGPLAGTHLLERIFSLSGSLYGCHRDADFPKVFLLSFPFSEMLSPEMDVELLKQELCGCLEQLRKNGADVIAIACNTLHAFLSDNEDAIDLVHVPQIVASAIPSYEKPLVLCTSTSVQFGLHKRFFPCSYPDLKTQFEVDKIIDQILKGIDRQVVLKKLLSLLETQESRAIVLGCTELSLFSHHLSLKHKLIIDPLEITANKLLEKSFVNIGDKEFLCQKNELVAK